jgi:hypothetical protein
LAAFDGILRAHAVSDGAFVEEAAKARQTGDLEAADRIRTAWDVNENAYFLMLFARFEDMAKKAVADRVERALTASGLTLAPDQVAQLLHKVDWPQRLALLTDWIGTDNHRVLRDWNRDRNRIAHGALLDERPNVVLAAELFRSVATRLQDTP